MKISVIIPCFNAEKTIERAISSALKQSSPFYEIIIVDNNSSDKSFLIMSKLQGKNILIKLYSETKKGAPAARNKGLEKASGDYVLFLDADDELKEDFVNDYLEKVAENQNPPDILVGGYCEVKVNIKESKVPIKYDNPFIGLFYKNLGKTSSILFKRDSLVKVNGWNTHQILSQEYELLFRMLKNKMTIDYYQDCQVNIYEENDDSLTRGNQGLAWEVFLELRLQICKFLESEYLQVFKDEYEKLMNFYFHTVRRLYVYNPDRANHYFNLFFSEYPLKVQKLEKLNILYKFSLVFLGFSRSQHLWRLIKRK